MFELQEMLERKARELVDVREANWRDNYIADRNSRICELLRVPSPPCHASAVNILKAQIAFSLDRKKTYPEAWRHSANRHNELLRALSAEKFLATTRGTGNRLSNILAQIASNARGAA